MLGYKTSTSCEEAIATPEATLGVASGLHPTAWTRSLGGLSGGGTLPLVSQEWRTGFLQ